ncbi:UNKNOWN [Stylonychia lemnae]|uniref:Dickkopf N-terminal cysteine-rich domain-containing protein n=1 Tax=Stylonychia lemnae TaxID=5949 RepID=A0A077ZZR1_STYLE|nr:UNKNOWN [Stylonychia lemnae]|eukprot:CDW74703.1 UNKNOWN [Stylonychia lemnae]
MSGLDLCYKQDILNKGTILMKKCPIGQYCHEKLNRCMSDPFKSYQGKLPGESCNYNYQCLSQNCQPDFKLDISACNGIQVGETCKLNFDCGVGLFCNKTSNICQQLNGIQMNCQDDKDCENNAVCSNNKCVGISTIDNYQESSTELACKSGFLSKVNEKQSICMSTPIIIGQQLPDYRCNTIQDSCTYQYYDHNLKPAQFKLKCECGLSQNGNTSYCPKIYHEEYTQILNETISRLGMNCHTLNRFKIYECLQQNIRNEDDMELLRKYTVLYFQREMNSKIRDEGIQCLKTHSFLSQYWNALEHLEMKQFNYSSQNRRNVATILRQPQFGMLSLCFIFMIYFSYQ